MPLKLSAVRMNEMRSHEGNFICAKLFITSSLVLWISLVTPVSILKFSKRDIKSNSFIRVVSLGEAFLKSQDSGDCSLKIHRGQHSYRKEIRKKKKRNKNIHYYLILY